MAANAGVAAARLGAKAHYWGRIGNDPLGDRIIAQLAAEGVDITTVRRVDGCDSPSAAIIVDERGERLICVYDDPALDDDPSWLPLASVAEFNAVLADVRWPAGAASVLEAARAARVPTVFDGDTGPADALRDLAARADYSIFSEPGLAIASASAEPGEGLRRMARTTPGVVGVTLGADGFLWLERGRERRARPPAIRAVDTLAAGDVFHAAFAVAVAEHCSIAGAAEFANAAAALKCARFGGRLGAPTRAEVEALLRPV
jgi:sulfofructose kinase